MGRIPRTTPRKLYLLNIKDYEKRIKKTNGDTEAKSICK